MNSKMRRILIYICGLMLFVCRQEVKAGSLQIIAVPSEGLTQYGEQYVSYANNDNYGWNEYIITPNYSGYCEVTVSVMDWILTQENSEVICGLGDRPTSAQGGIKDIYHIFFGRANL